MALWNRPESGPENIVEPSPIYLGQYFDTRKRQAGDELTYDGERHLLLFGPNGSGKGTRLLVNNLLRLRNRSLVVIDPKGELTAITADYRRTLGDVIVLNPFEVLGLGGTGFNPLASLDPDAATFIDDATGIGEALVKVDPNEKDPHWSDSARNLIVALVMWEVIQARKAARQPSLERVRYLLTQPDEFETREDGKRGPQVAGLRFTAMQMCAAGGFEIESLAGRFLREADEIFSIQSTADRHTSWMLSPLMRSNLNTDGIDFANLKNRPTTVYIILPAERMRTHAVWLRLVIVSALRALYKPGGLKTLFMLDEFAQLGHLAPIEDAFGLVRGYGVQLWPVLQDVNQLKALYKERWETFVGNAGVVQAFAPNDLTTSEWMSRRTGDTTIAAAGWNTGDQQSTAGQGSLSTGLAYSQVKRPLFLPQELMDFPQGSGLLWPSGTSKSVPFLASSYWSVPSLAKRARPNPYFEKTMPVANAPEAKIVTQTVPSTVTTAAPPASNAVVAVAAPAVTVPVTPSVALSEIVSAQGVEFFPVSILKLVVMSVCTLGFYELFWFYRNWEFIQERHKLKINPFLRAFFAPLFCFQCFDRIKDRAVDLKIGMFEPAVGAVVWIGLTFASRAPPPWFFLTFLSSGVLIPIQMTVNRINTVAAPGHDPNSRFTIVNWLIAIVGGILLLLMILGSFVPDPPATK